MTTFELAQKYYPRMWNESRLQALLKAGKLTQEEYDAIVNPVEEVSTKSKKK